MNNNRKAWIVVVCLVLILLSTVFTTLAYLTDNDNKAVNTFTVGDVQIELYEYEVDPETGEKKVDANNQYIPKKADDVFTGNKNVKLIPGRVVSKEPFIKVLPNSEDCYVRAIVTVNAPNKTTDFEVWARNFENVYFLYGQTNGFNPTNWEKVHTNVDTNAQTITYTLNYKNSSGDYIVEAGANGLVLEALFDGVAIPTKLDNAALAELVGLEITVVAQAIQAEGFEPDGVKSARVVAWEAFEEQVKSN